MHTYTERRTHEHTVVARTDERCMGRRSGAKMRRARGCCSSGRGFYRRISIALHSLEPVCIGFGVRARRRAAEPVARPRRARKPIFSVGAGDLVISRRRVGGKDNAKVRRQVNGGMSCLSSGAGREGRRVTAL